MIIRVDITKETTLFIPTVGRGGSFGKGEEGGWSGKGGGRKVDWEGWKGTKTKFSGEMDPKLVEKLRVLVLGYRRMVIPEISTFDHPSTIDKHGSALVWAYENHDDPERFVHDMGYYLTDYVRWTLEDFGLYHLERFKARPMVRQWIDLHREILEELACPESNAPRQRMMLAVACIPWLENTTIIYRSEDSMLPPTTDVRVFKAHPFDTNAMANDVLMAWGEWTGNPLPGLAISQRMAYLDAMMTYIKRLTQD